VIWLQTPTLLARWRNYFSQILNIHGINVVRQTEIHTAKPLVPEVSASEVELGIEKLKSHKSPGTDQIPAEIIKVGGTTMHYEIYKLIITMWNKEELHDEWKSRSLYLSTRRATKQTVVIIEARHFCQQCTKFYPTSCSKGLLHMQRKSLRITYVDFDAICQLLIAYSAFVRYLRKNGKTKKHCIGSLLSSRKLMVQ